ncbi:hypothetical protein GP486_000581 [Trichoglossum hirsutum]|uniref:Uncharacterized protein n=1 Tax=Trichoglossum hirsutum TaxID=265104 RepID=A0A9P8LIB7_9PEZI|nr:hypothetical protein GP486_000581 [Trichoglossum hirsutum]
MGPSIRSLRSSAAPTALPNRRRSGRVLRHAQRKDDDSSGDSGDDDESYSAPIQRGRSDRVLRSGKRQKLSRRSSRFQPLSPSPSHKRARARKRVVQRTRSPTRSLKTTPKKLKQSKQGDGTGVIQSEGRIPPWESLPYYILVRIFTFAAYPLYDDMYWHQPSIGWLLKLSRVCRSFAEPALTALYHTPPLLPSYRPFALLKLLALPPSEKTFKYNSKVRRLEVEVSRTLFPVSRSHGHLDISALILQLPQLEDLEFFHLVDRPPYRERALVKEKLAKMWSYPDFLFVALENAGVRLRSWRWNAWFWGANRGLSQLEYIHLQPAFRGLKRLGFTNYDQSDGGCPDSSGGATNEEYLARAISVLHNLKSLNFEYCSVVNEVLLPLLPENLSILSITNCPNLTSDILHPFLITHGSHLRELILDHNQSLNLSFLPDLERACPKLGVFKMDFKYYHNDFLRSSEPQFEDLLFLHEVPTWPPMLESIELIHLRKWNLEVADMFFRSLINAASSLPHLRKLVLRVILKIGWRDRAHFRDDWIHKLERIFLRKPDPPNIELQSLSRWKAHKATVEAEDQKERAALNDETDEDIVVRRPRRSLRTKLKDMKEAEHEASSQALESRVSRPTNLAESPKDEEYVDGVQVVLWNKSDAQLLINLANSQSRSTRSRRRPTRLTELERLELSAGKDRPVHRYSPDSERSDTGSTDTESNGNSDNDSYSDSNSGCGDTDGSSDTGKRRKDDSGEITQGMCSVVDIRIDNLRPTETQFVEDDFLDEEISGDDEWDGNDLIFGDQSYAW